MFDRLKSFRRKPVEAACAVQMENKSNPTAAAIADPARVDVPWVELDGLLQPGEAVTLPAPRIVEPEPVTVTAPEPVQAAEPTNPDTRPIDLDEERRTDLAPRSPGRITYLLRHESPAQTKARIENDWLRVAFRRG